MSVDFDANSRFESEVWAKHGFWTGRSLLARVYGIQHVRFTRHFVEALGTPIRECYLIEPERAILRRGGCRMPHALQERLFDRWHEADLDTSEEAAASLRAHGFSHRFTEGWRDVPFDIRDFWYPPKITSTPGDLQLLANVRRRAYADLMACAALDLLWAGGRDAFGRPFHKRCHLRSVALSKNEPGQCWSDNCARDEDGVDIEQSLHDFVKAVLSSLSRSDQSSQTEHDESALEQPATFPRSNVPVVSPQARDAGGLADNIGWSHDQWRCENHAYDKQEIPPEQNFTCLSDDYSTSSVFGSAFETLEEPSEEADRKPSMTMWNDLSEYELKHFLERFQQQYDRYGKKIDLVLDDVDRTALQALREMPEPNPGLWLTADICRSQAHYFAEEAFCFVAGVADGQDAPWRIRASSA